MNAISLTRQIALFLAFISLAGWAVPNGSGRSLPPASRSAVNAGAMPVSDGTTAKVDWALKHQPVSFVENRGQIDPRVAFYVEGGGTTLYFTSEGVIFNLPEKRKKGDASQALRRWTIRLDFIAARKNVKPVGEAPTPTLISYFKGPKDQWKSGLETYSRLVYRELWPGIDLAYSGAENEVKYEFTVKPGADPSPIRWAYRGATVVPDASGGLKIDTPLGGLEDKQPYSYQEQAGRRVPVATAFKVQPGPNSQEKVCGFSIGAYDRSRQLTIDPAVIAYAGYIGGNFVDTAFGIAVDSAGAAYVAGYTESLPSDGFPVVVGPGLNFNTNKLFLFSTAFVAKIKPDGSALQYCGYIDGGGHQLASAIAVDSTGAAYVTGFTTSDQTTFPVTVGPSLTYSGGSQFMNDFLGDAFVAKVKPDGTGLVYCGYIGGQGDDAGYGIAVDGAGNAYVTGETTSPGPGQAGAAKPFPAIGGPSLVNAGAPSFAIPDAFIAKVKADGSGVAYAGFIGGTGLDEGLGVAVDGAGAAYVTGVTNSPPAGFAGLGGGPSLTLAGGTDAFVAKVKPDGSSLVYCGYIGGANDDEGMGIAVDSSGSAYVTGETGSDQSTFPVKVGPSLTFGGARADSGDHFVPGDAFVAKVSPGGSSLIYCGYIGGSGGDAGYRIAVDSAGSAYITGSTSSSAATFPVTAASGAAATFSGGSVFGDAFIAKVDPSGSKLLYAGYLGGSGDDAAVGIAVDASGNVYVAGGTLSSAPSFPATVGPFLTFKPGPFGEADAFVAKVTGLPQPPPPTPDFSLSFAQPVIMTTGGKSRVTLDITRTNGFTGNVTIGAPMNTPRGVIVVLDPSTPVSGDSLGFKIKVKGSAEVGTDLLVFTGVDDSGKLNHMVTLTLMVESSAAQ
ncbi:MAG TPA: SBBP repeat-containing protein [Blastocatellia bacterium]|nr:SBBP repeat-containing protein [Blastocatellia bacterium]